MPSLVGRSQGDVDFLGFPLFGKSGGAQGNAIIGSVGFRHRIFGPEGRPIVVIAFALPPAGLDGVAQDFEHVSVAGTGVDLAHQVIVPISVQLVGRVAGDEEQQIGPSVVRMGIVNSVRVFEQRCATHAIANVIAAADVQRLVDIPDQVDDVAQRLSSGESLGLALQHGDAVVEAVDDVIGHRESTLVNVFEGSQWQIGKMPLVVVGVVLDEPLGLGIALERAGVKLVLHELTGLVSPKRDGGQVIRVQDDTHLGQHVIGDEGLGEVGDVFMPKLAPRQDRDNPQPIEDQENDQSGWVSAVWRSFTGHGSARVRRRDSAQAGPPPGWLASKRPRPG